MSSLEIVSSVGRPSSETRRQIRNELARRYQMFQKEGKIPTDEIVTQRGLFYKLRKLMGGQLIGINSKDTYKAFTQMLREEVKRLGCIGEGRCTGWRETLGIIASERAQFFHRGISTPVRHDNVTHLASKGYDIILCEKEGIVELLQAYACPLGVAIINCRGFSPDYVKWLVKLAQAEDNKANVYVLSDMDASGFAMQENSYNVPRLGVDQQMLSDLGTPIEEVEENAESGADTHLKYLADTGHYSPEFVEWLSEQRVEIDAVLAYVKPTRFWQYLKQRMELINAKRRLIRSIYPQWDFPPEFSEILDAIKEAASEPGRNAIQDEIEAEGYAEYKTQEIMDVQNIEEDLVKLGKEAIEKSEIYKQVLAAMKQHVLPMCQPNFRASPKTTEENDS